ncbi:MAG TPA: hypothetical protein VKT52_11825 [Ktedonobacterales bacterium]|nr:hypothetical protein [Ktedonobacterales bacterium]
MDSGLPLQNVSIEYAAAHLATIVLRCDPDAHFGPCPVHVLAMIDGELTVSEDVRRWYRTLTPLTTISVPQAGNDLTVYHAAELIDQQVG